MEQISAILQRIRNYKIGNTKMSQKNIQLKNHSQKTPAWIILDSQSQNSSPLNNNQTNQDQNLHLNKAPCLQQQNYDRTNQEKQKNKLIFNRQEKLEEQVIAKSNQKQIMNSSNFQQKPEEIQEVTQSKTLISKHKNKKRRRINRSRLTIKKKQKTLKNHKVLTSQYCPSFQKSIFNFKDPKNAQNYIKNAKMTQNDIKMRIKKKFTLRKVYCSSAQEIINEKDPFIDIQLDYPFLINKSIRDLHDVFLVSQLQYIKKNQSKKLSQI